MFFSALKAAFSKGEGIAGKVKSVAAAAKYFV